MSKITQTLRISFLINFRALLIHLKLYICYLIPLFKFDYFWMERASEFIFRIEICFRELGKICSVYSYCWNELNACFSGFLDLS